MKKTQLIHYHIESSNLSTALVISGQRSKRLRFIHCCALLTLFSLLLIPLQYSFSTSDRDSYNSGYSHGCDDAGISNPSDHYINQPGKGAKHHTEAFMRGYDDGYYKCLGDADHIIEETTVKPKSSNQKFIVQVTFVDGPKDGPTLVSMYLKEHPAYSSPNVDLIDAMYDDDPRTANGQYTTKLILPAGLIETGERFQICLVDEDTGNTVECYQLVNGIKKEPEKLTIGV